MMNNTKRPVARYIVRCPYCKSSFVIEGSAPWNRPAAEVLALVMGHAVKCEKTEVRIRVRINPYRLEDASFAAYRDESKRQAAARDLMACDWKTTQVRGVVNTAVKCDGRCTHAKGGDCECSCGGANHGSQL